MLITASLAFARAAAAQADPQVFGRWADTTFGKAYEGGDAFSGMGLIVVRDGRIVLQRAYGKARYAPDRPIDPARTQFLIGSITKTFTGLAIAQLVERGRIRSIDDPVNRYLKRTQLPGARGARTTIRDLLTHSAGFDQRSRDVGRHREIGAPIEDAEIRRIAPSQVRDPGQLVSYSNYGTGILAVVVEDVTGMPIETYFRRNIWAPLGMTGAHFQTVRALGGTNGQAYDRNGDGWDAQPFIAFHPFYWPVGAISMTLDDAARYLRFQLDAAQGRDTPALSARMHAQLRSRLRANGPAVGGFGYLMMSFEWNGHKVFGHGGTWPGYESMMLVIPDQNIAVFFSILGPKAIGNLRAFNMVLAELLGPYRPAGAYITLSPEQLRSYEGVYRPTMRAGRTVEGAVAFLAGGDGVRVKAVPAGLMIGADGPFQPAGNDVFWSPKADQSAANPFGSPIFAFKRENGEPRYLIHLAGLAPMERVSAWADPALRAAGLHYLGYVLLLGLPALLWRRLRRRDWLSIATAILPLTVFALPLVLFSGLGAGGLGAYLLEGWSRRFALMLAIGDLVAVCAVVTLGTAIVWRDDAARPMWNRVHAAGLAVIQLLAAALLWSVNLIGFA